MRYKFGEDFRIYGLDFNIGQPAHWVSFDKVVVSIDRAKSDAHSTIFGDSGFWDVIVFDEAREDRQSTVEPEGAVRGVPSPSLLRAGLMASPIDDR